jgi:hypothetical protein
MTDAELAKALLESAHVVGSQPHYLHGVDKLMCQAAERLSRQAAEGEADNLTDFGKRLAEFERNPSFTLEPIDNPWIRMIERRPQHLQRIFYYFEPFKSFHVGTYVDEGGLDASGEPASPMVEGKSGFTTVDPEVPFWMPAPDVPA